MALSVPELAEKGAFSAWEKYSVADVKDVVAFAADLGIRVVVEVDGPGHTSSFCKSHPEVCPSPSCGDANALAPDTEATFDLIEKLYADVADATTDHVMHLGGALLYCCLLPRCIGTRCTGTCCIGICCCLLHCCLLHCCLLHYVNCDADPGDEVQYSCWNNSHQVRRWIT